MARPIEETPVITGKDAERFEEEIKHRRPEDPENIRRGRELYEYFKAKGAFDNIWG
ncbi:MAG: hypothetical protein LUC88_05640 [Prevotella sp.]|nr:hypothetical protein [Prevotella sp.]